MLRRQEEQHTVTILVSFAESTSIRGPSRFGNEGRRMSFAAVPWLDDGWLIISGYRHPGEDDARRGPSPVQVRDSSACSKSLGQLKRVNPFCDEENSLREALASAADALYQKRPLDERLFGTATGDALESGFMRISEQGLNLSARSDVPRTPMLGSLSAFQRFKPTPMKLPPVYGNGPMLASSAVFNLLLAVFPLRFAISCCSSPIRSVR